MLFSSNVNLIETNFHFLVTKEYPGDKLRVGNKHFIIHVAVVILRHITLNINRRRLNRRVGVRSFSTIPSIRANYRQESLFPFSAE